MQFSIAIRLLQMLPTQRKRALSAPELAERWHGVNPDQAQRRNMERWLADLSVAASDEPPMVEIVPGKPRRYYLKLTHVARWFLTEEAALNLLLTRQVLGRSLGALKGVDSSEWIQAAERITSASPETRRIREKVRVVPDGIGRLPARIDPEVFAAVVDAISRERQVAFYYTSSKAISTKETVSPQGMVAKDGTIYLLGTTGITGKPRHFPLHRISNAEISRRSCQQRFDFNLDRYIETTHGLSHILGADLDSVKLELLVAPETIYHFKERPLSEEQIIADPKGKGGWYRVTAIVPHTILLSPFLLSMGHWVNVLGPPAVRQEVGERIVAAAKHYEELPDAPE